MNINIQRFIVTAQPVTGIVVANHQLTVVDSGFYTSYYVFTGFNLHTVDHILCENDIDILIGNDGIEISYHTGLFYDITRTGKTICSGFLTGGNACENRQQDKACQAGPCYQVI
jgi:hypothetical protein